MLDVVGGQMTDGFNAMVVGATKAGNTETVALAADGRRMSLLARLDVNKRLPSDDEAAAKSAERGAIRWHETNPGAARYRDQGN